MRVEAVSVITSACVALWLAVGCLPLLTPAQAQAFSHSRIHADEEPPLPAVVALIGQRRSEITAVFPGRDRMFFHGAGGTACISSSAAMGSLSVCACIETPGSLNSRRTPHFGN